MNDIDKKRIARATHIMIGLGLFFIIIGYVFGLYSGVLLKEAEKIRDKAESNDEKAIEKANEKEDTASIFAFIISILYPAGAAILIIGIIFAWGFKPTHIKFKSRLPDTDVSDENVLKEVKKMHEEGQLNDEEFERVKANILKGNVEKLSLSSEKYLLSKYVFWKKVKEDPKNPKLLFRFAIKLLNDGHKDLAIDFYNKSLNCDLPDDYGSKIERESLSKLRYEKYNFDSW